MKVVIQRVKKARVLVENKVFSEIEKGYLVFVGFCQGDTQEKVLKMVDKVANLRVMADENGKMNYNLIQTKGEILVVSQFTLCADTSQRRPSFISAMKEEEAKKLYLLFIDELKKRGLTVKTGKFGNYMKIELINDGPVTIILEN